MNTLHELISSNNVHHAYVLVGERSHIREHLFTFLEQNLNVRVLGNPDFSYAEFPTFTIDAARNLAVSQSRKDIGCDRKFFVLAVDGMTEESQNALLKMFEEPTPGTHFFIIAPQNNFLPTFLSRIQLIHVAGEVGVVSKNKKDQKEESILTKTLPERLALVGKLATDISDEKKTKQHAITLVNIIEAELIQQGIEKQARALTACENARAALFSRGAMIKMILENLMLQI